MPPGRGAGPPQLSHTAMSPVRRMSADDAPTLTPYVPRTMAKASDATFHTETAESATTNVIVCAAGVHTFSKSTSTFFGTRASAALGALR